MSCILPNRILAGTGTGTQNSVAKWETVSEISDSLDVYIDSNGQMSIGKPTADAMLDIECRASTVQALKIKAAPGQSSDLIKVVDENDNSLFVINYKGDFGITVQSPNEPLHVQSDYDGNRAIRMGNESSGTSAVARFIVDVLGGSSFLAAYGSNFTTSGSKRANSASLITNNSMANGLSLVARNASGGNIRFYTGGNTDANERMVITPNGIIKIGDLDSTHYAQFASDGEFTLFGNARVEIPYWIPANAIQAPQARPASLVDHGISIAWEFSDIGVEVNTEQVRANIGLPNNLDISVTPKLKIGWSSTTTSGNCYWQVEYLYTAENEDTTVAAQQILLSAETSSSTSDGLRISEFTLQAPTALDACLHIRLTRRSDDALDTINGDTVELHGICLYYTSNKLGEAL